MRMLGALLLSLILLCPFTAYAAGVDVYPDSLTYSPGEPRVGDTVVLTAVIKASGGAAEGVTVVFKVDGEYIGADYLERVDGAGTASMEWNASGTSEGEHQISITVQYNGDANITNNNLTQTVTLAPEPVPVYSLSSVGASPAQPKEGDAVTLSGRVINTGEVSGKATLEFYVDDEATSSAVLVLNPDQEKAFNFTWTAVVGTHTLKVAVGSTSKTVSITVAPNPKAVIHCTEIRVSPVHPVKGEEATITATVENSGDLGESVTVIIKDGTRKLAERKVDLPPGSVEKVSVTWYPSKGTHVLRVEVSGHPEAVRTSTVSVEERTSRICGPSFVVLGVAALLLVWRR